MSCPFQNTLAKKGEFFVGTETQYAKRHLESFMRGWPGRLRLLWNRKDTRSLLQRAVGSDGVDVELM